MTTVSFMSANFVARQVGYNMTRGWGQGDRSTSEYFAPIETFGDRFDELLSDIRRMGFDAMDLWTSHVSPTWATEQHVAIARALLRKHDLQVISFAGWFGSTPEEFSAMCRLANDLGVRILGGSTSMLDKDRAWTIDMLTRHDLVLGLENHPEKTPEELLARIGDGDGRLGACVDTGWFGTQGYDAAQALERIGDRLVHVHLKDVRAVGSHDTCRYGQGIVPIENCVRTLQRIGYRGGISVEHEPELFDPTDDSIASAAMLRAWLADTQEDRS